MTDLQAHAKAARVILHHFYDRELSSDDVEQILVWLDAYQEGRHAEPPAGIYAIGVTHTEYHAGYRAGLVCCELGHLSQNGRDALQGSADAYRAQAEQDYYMEHIAAHHNGEYWRARPTQALHAVMQAQCHHHENRTDRYMAIRKALSMVVTTRWPYDCPKPPTARIPDGILSAVEEAHQRYRAHQEQSAPVLAPADPNVRLINRLRELVEEYVEDCSYRRSQSTWAGGNHTTSIFIDEQPRCAGESHRVWSANRNWQGNDSHHDFTVTIRFLRAHRLDCAVVDGLLTLDLGDEIEPGICPAAWAAQSRGFDLKLVRGFLARTKDGWAHAKSMRAARKAMAK